VKRPFEFPIRRMELSDLSEHEATSLGRNIQNVDHALRQYWSIRFESDLIQRVYVTYFHDSVFGNSNLDHQSQEWHMHMHLIPRTMRLAFR
jgi:galactose-1-phosphate uridylyltransferase